MIAAYSASFYTQVQNQERVRMTFENFLGVESVSCGTSQATQKANNHEITAERRNVVRATQFVSNVVSTETQQMEIVKN